MFDEIMVLWQKAAAFSPLIVLLFKNEIMAWWNARSIFLDREYDDGDPTKPDFCGINGADNSWGEILIFQYTRPKPFRRILGKIKKKWGMGGVYYAALFEVEKPKPGQKKYGLRWFHKSMITWSHFPTSHMPAERKKLWMKRIKEEPEEFDMSCQPWGAPFSLDRYGCKS